MTTVRDLLAKAWRWVNPSSPGASPPAGRPTPPSTPPEPRDVLSLYKLEYERAAIRYNDIYNAIWQIFSYMSVVSGGILAFGAEHFHFALLFFLALFPLVFWFWAVFRPHDGYGESCLQRLKELEADLNLHHYKRFEGLKDSQDHKRELRNVKTWVSGVFVMATAVWLGFGMYAGYVHFRCHTKLILPGKSTELKIVVPGPEGQRKSLDERNITAPKGATDRRAAR